MIARAVSGLFSAALSGGCAAAALSASEALPMTVYALLIPLPWLIAPALRLQLRQQLLQAPPGAWLLISRDGRILGGSEALHSFTGISGTSLREQPAERLIGSRAWQRLAEAGAQGRPAPAVRLDCQLPDPEGRRLERLAVARPQRRLWRSPRWLLHFPDLAGDNPAEVRLRLLRRQHQALLEHGQDLVLHLSTSGAIVHANAYARALLGGKGKDIRGRRIIDFIDAGSAQDFMDQFANLLEGKAAPARLPALGLQTARSKAPWKADARLLPLPSEGRERLLLFTAHGVNRYVAALEQARASEARFFRIFHSSPDAIGILRAADATVLDCNAGFTRMLGYTREHTVGESVRSLNLVPDRDTLKSIAQRLELERACDNQPTRLRARSGTLIAVELSVRYVEIDGELCLLCIGRDITAREQMEKARRESEAKFEQMFSRSPDGICILRRQDAVLLDINDMFIRSSGYEREDLIGHSIMNLPLFSDAEQTRAAVQTLRTQNKLDSFELNLTTRDGRTLPTLISASELEIAGEPCIMCIAKDVSDLRNAEARLRSSEQRFRGAFENAPIGILLVDMEGRIYMANHFAAELLAYEEAQLSGVHVSRLVPSEDRIHLKDALERLVHGSESIHRAERRILCHSGLELWTNFQIVLQRDSEGAPLYFILQIADITEMKMSQRRMERMAFYDTLTDLANRRLFHERLNHTISHCGRSGSLAALLYLDLDQFKRVNDTLGHEAGDSLLRQVAGRLTECVRAEDTVGRPGGDEFTILLHEISAPGDAGRVAEKILQRLRDPISLSGHALVVTTSIGIAIINDRSNDPNIVHKQADLAMYRAKERGRNNFQYYSEEMNTQAVKRLRTENELRTALERSEFELYFQPKVRLTDKLLTGAEALIRWQHPERGLLNPGEFIEVAEETGAIVAIGEWLFAEACRISQQLTKIAGRPFTVAINISPRQFRDPNLVNHIRRCLRETACPPELLEIEITETMLMHDVDAAAETLRRLHTLGLRLAIDDFGTGYSSLNYLKRFPIDTIKVDRSFVMDIPESADDMAITAAVIAMAHQLNMEVVAEGVEKPEQLEFLQNQNCEYAQGFLFSKPRPVQDIQRMLAPNIHMLRS